MLAPCLFQELQALGPKQNAHLHTEDRQKNDLTNGQKVLLEAGWSRVDLCAVRIRGCPNEKHLDRDKVKEPWESIGQRA